MSLNASRGSRKSGISELLEPKIAPKFRKEPSKKETPKPSVSDLDGDGHVDSFEKNVRQFIYDVHHIMKEKNVTLERAYQMRAARTNYGQGVIDAAKEKLGIKSGGVSEDRDYRFGRSGERLYRIVVRYKNGTTLRKRTSQSEIYKIRQNPNVASVEKTDYAPNLDKFEKEKPKLDPVGREDADVNNNGIPNDKSDKYIMKRRDAIGKAIANRRGEKNDNMDEGFSNWRRDLFEVIDDEIESSEQEQIKKKKVNNKINTKPSISETVKSMGGVVLSDEDITDEYLLEKLHHAQAKLAADYFCEHGLNEYGIDILIEKLGLDEFCEYVEDIADGYSSFELMGGRELNESKLRRKRRIATKTARAKQFETDDVNIKKVKKGVLEALQYQSEPEETDLMEKSPPGFEGTVKAMKRHSEIDNPWALAWYMKDKGFKSHRTKSGKKKMNEALVADNPNTEKQNQTQDLQQKNQQQQIRKTAATIGKGLRDKATIVKKVANAGVDPTSL